MTDIYKPIRDWAQAYITTSQQQTATYGLAAATYELAQADVARSLLALLDAMPAPALTLAGWENVIDGEVQRLAVPGGWLYRACAWEELPSYPGEPNRGYWRWSDAAFVPEPRS